MREVRSGVRFFGYKNPQDVQESFSGFLASGVGRPSLILGSLVSSYDRLRVTSRSRILPRRGVLNLYPIFKVSRSTPSLDDKLLEPKRSVYRMYLRGY